MPPIISETNREILEKLANSLNLDFETRKRGVEIILQIEKDHLSHVSLLFMSIFLVR